MDCPITEMASPEVKDTSEEDSSVEREKALDMALSQIERQFGEGAVMKMGERGQMKVEAVSSGSLAIDVALGIGGLPRGRVAR